MHRVRILSFHALSRHAALLIFSGSPTWKLPKSYSFGFLWRLHDIGMIDEITGHWLLTDSTSSPSPLPGSQKGATESYNPLITGFAPLVTRPTISCFLRVTILTQQKTLITLNTWEITRVLGALS